MPRSALQQRATTSGGLVKTSTQLQPAQLERIDEIAEREGLSRAAIISRLIGKGLEAEQSGAAA